MGLVERSNVGLNDWLGSNATTVPATRQAPGRYACRSLTVRARRPWTHPGCWPKARDRPPGATRSTTHPKATAIHSPGAQRREPARSHPSPSQERPAARTQKARWAIAPIIATPLSRSHYR